MSKIIVAALFITGLSGALAGNLILALCCVGLMVPVLYAPHVRCQPAQATQPAQHGMPGLKPEDQEKVRRLAGMFQANGGRLVFGDLAKAGFAVLEIKLAGWIKDNPVRWDGGYLPDGPVAELLNKKEVA